MLSFERSETAEPGDALKCDRRTAAALALCLPVGFVIRNLLSADNPRAHLAEENERCLKKIMDVEDESYERRQKPLEDKDEGLKIVPENGRLQFTYTFNLHPLYEHRNDALYKARFEDYILNWVRQHGRWNAWNCGDVGISTTVIPNENIPVPGTMFWYEFSCTLEPQGLHGWVRPLA